MFDLTQLCLFVLKSFLCLNRYFCSRNLKFKLAATQAIPMAAPQRSTPYFSISDNVEVLQQLPSREGVLLPKSSGRVVEGCSKSNCCSCLSCPVIRGHIRGCLGESFIKMNCCNTYKEEDLDKWTKSAKFKIWDAAQAEFTDEDRHQFLSICNGTDAPPVFNAATFFNKNNLILSWMDSNSLDRIGELSPKVNLVFHFDFLGDEFNKWEKWAREKNVLLVNQDSLVFDETSLEQVMKRQSFGAACNDTINTLANFLKLTQYCPVCKERRILHAVFVCSDASKSVGALLATIMLFDYCDKADSVLSCLLSNRNRRVWQSLPLVDHTYILEALFHQQHCIQAMIGR